MANIVGISLGAVLCLCLAPAAYGSLPLDEQIDLQRQELERLQSEIQKNQKRSQETFAHEKSILSALQESEDRIRVHEKKLALLQLKIQREDREIARIGKEADVSREEVQKKKDHVEKRVRDLYKAGAGRNLSVLFSARTEYDFEQRIYFLKWDAKKQQEFMEQFNKQVKNLEEKNRQLQEIRLELNREKTEQVQELTGIREEQRNKRMLLASIHNERSTYEKAISELDEASLQLQLLLKDLKEKRSKEFIRGGFAREKGRLIWPNGGPVVALFGKQKHPKFDTYIYRKGIEIRPDTGETVKAIYDGRVIYADWFRGYGMIIILDHGDNYYSLYAHLAKLLVSVGERVARNFAIGKVGETGLVQESRLYFEIRHQGEPMDPMAWLEKRQQGGKR